MSGPVSEEAVEALAALLAAQENRDWERLPLAWPAGYSDEAQAHKRANATELLTAALPFIRSAVVEECAKVLREHADGEDALADLAVSKCDYFDEAEHRKAAAALRSVVPALSALAPKGGAR